jgi:hypothetical protein
VVGRRDAPPGSLTRLAAATAAAPQLELHIVQLIKWAFPIVPYRVGGKGAIRRATVWG